MLDIGSVGGWYSGHTEGEAPNVSRLKKSPAFSLKPSVPATEAREIVSGSQEMFPIGPASPALSERPSGAEEVSLQMQQVSEAASLIQDQVSRVAPNIEVRVDEDTGIFVVKVFDNKSGEMIRQIPTQEVVDLASQMDKIVGLIFDKKG